MPSIFFDCSDPIRSVPIRRSMRQALLSFIGSICYIMGLSGLKEVLSVMFVPNSVDYNMLSGHAYSRAIRGHTLLQLVLALRIFNELSLNDEQKELLDIWLSNLSTFEGVKESRAVQELKKYMTKNFLKLKTEVQRTLWKDQMRSSEITISF